MKVIRLTNEPRKNMSIAVIGNPVPNDGVWHTFLKELKKLEIDIFFLMNQKKKVNSRKFSTLYDATYYAIPENESEQELNWKAIEYIAELGGGYDSVFVFSQEDDIKDNQNVYLTSIERIQTSLIESSIFSCKKLSWNEIKEIYEENTQPKISDVFSRFLELFTSRDENARMFESSVTEDKIIFLRPTMIRQLQDYFDNNPNYYRSFKTSNWKVFIASSVNKICDNLRMNLDIRDVRLNTIRR